VQIRKGKGKMNIKPEQKKEESEIPQLKSGMGEIEARLLNRKMRRAYKFHHAGHGNFKQKERAGR